MDLSKFVKPYEKLLEALAVSPYFGRYAITHFINRQELRNTGIRDFYSENALVLKQEIAPGDYIEVTHDEHPTICGGVTEYLTKIKLARQLNRKLEELHFFDDIRRAKYIGLSDEELAFALYEPDILYRSGYGYSREIIDNKKKIINKAILLSDIALALINKTFPIIESVNFHPEGHVNYLGKIAIKGDSDLLINNCLIDFKTKKEIKLPKAERAQLFAYALHKLMRDGFGYQKVYFLNPRFNILEELVLAD